MGDLPGYFAALTPARMLVSVGERVVDTPLLEFIEELLTASERTGRGPQGVSGTR